jgi:hypothetical protein
MGLMFMVLLLRPVRVWLRVSLRLLGMGPCWWLLLGLLQLCLVGGLRAAAADFEEYRQERHGAGQPCS